MYNLGAKENGQESSKLTADSEKDLIGTRFGVSPVSTLVLDHPSQDSQLMEIQGFFCVSGDDLDFLIEGFGMEI